MTLESYVPQERRQDELKRIVDDLERCLARARKLKLGMLAYILEAALHEARETARSEPATLYEKSAPRAG
jgi:hypothetical protein